MKKWISMLMMVAMVVSTTMPAASHASMNHDHSGKVAHSEKAASAEQASAHADCDHHSEKASGKTQTKHEKPCCEKGMCKCIGGNCHSGGMAKLSGDGSIALLTRDANGNQFAFAEEHIESATLARLKRPPKA